MVFFDIYIFTASYRNLDLFFIHWFKLGAVKHCFFFLFYKLWRGFGRGIWERKMKKKLVFETKGTRFCCIKGMTSTKWLRQRFLFIYEKRNHPSQNTSKRVRKLNFTLIPSTHTHTHERTPTRAMANSSFRECRSYSVQTGKWNHRKNCFYLNWKH